MNHEEKRTNRIVTQTAVWVGPFWMLPVFFRYQWKTGLIAKTKNNIQPIHVSKTYRAVSPEPLLTRATQSARRIQPTTSFPTPAARTVTPTGVPRSLSSVRIRHSTGKAVIFATSISDEKKRERWDYVRRVQFRWTTYTARSLLAQFLGRFEIGDIGPMQ